MFLKGFIHQDSANRCATLEKRLGMLQNQITRRVSWILAQGLTPSGVIYHWSNTMPYEVGIRFLTDYHQGDIYFKTKHPGHNLDRARNQFRLVDAWRQLPTPSRPLSAGTAIQDDMGNLHDEVFADGFILLGGGVAVALLHEIAKCRHEEGRGADVETLVKGLACHARVIPGLEVVCDLVQRSQPGDHGTEQRLEETGSGEFAGMADDQLGLACDQIKVGQARTRAVGGSGFFHDELAGSLTLSSCHCDFFDLNR
jgi:hypothetical protein